MWKKNNLFGNWAARLDIVTDHTSVEDALTITAKQQSKKTAGSGRIEGTKHSKDRIKGPVEVCQGLLLRG